MDPFSADSELLTLSDAFHQGRYSACLDFETSSLSDSNQIPARVLQSRAKIALGDASDVLAELDGEEDPALVAVKALAQSALGESEEAAESVKELVASETNGENSLVQVVGGIVFANAGQFEDALALLGRHQGSLEAVALIVQIHLQQNRTDLALKEVQAARRWAQDSLLVNLAEAWVGLRVGGEKYQQAFYVFEELALAPSTSAIRSLIGQIVSELHLGRLPEAEAALQQATERDPKNADLLANTVVLNTILAKSAEAEQGLETLRSVDPNHSLLLDLQEKSEGFDKAATKYSAKVKS